jgi:hypothetical protein
MSIENKFDWKNMDFGTIDNPLCGICQCAVNNGNWDEDGELLEDVICADCENSYYYDEDEDAYVSI